MKKKVIELNPSQLPKAKAEPEPFVLTEKVRIGETANMYTTLSCHNQRREYKTQINNLLESRKPH